MPCHPPAAKPGSVSATVGTSGNSRQAMRRCDCQHGEAVRLDRAGQAGISFNDQRDTAAHHVGECGRRAPGVRHDLQFDIGPALQKQTRQVRYSSNPGRRKRNLIGILLGARDQIRQRLDTGRRARADEHRLINERGNGQEIARQHEGKVLRLAGQGDEQRDRRCEQRVAVRDGIGRGVSGNRPAGAGRIDRHDLLAQHGAKPIHHDPECNVDRAAGRGIGDDPDRLVRIVVRLRRRCSGGRKQQRAQRNKS